MWRSHVAGVVNRIDGLVPVVKGNGYGFGRIELARIAAEFSDTVAVGTVHELAGLPDTLHTVVLTPTLHAPNSTAPVLTVGNTTHIDALRGWAGRVLVKLTSSMQRYGRGVELVETARAAGLDVVGVSLHPPLAGSDDDHRREIERTLELVDADLPVWVSHIGPDTAASLPASHTYRVRLGTALWHGDKSFFHLAANVLDIRPVSAGARVGYRQQPVAGDGHLVMIGAGSANGVAPQADGQSPFHFGRERLALHEAPHMHTSMGFVPAGSAVPEIGSWVDLQRPLTVTIVDEYNWQ